MQMHIHNKSGASISGLRLAMGAILQEKDVYDSTSGKWDTCSCPGQRLEETTTVWVRPQAKLSENALILLGHLNQRGGDFYGGIGKFNGNYYVIPNPTFNWDFRIDIETERVTHPRCVQELSDYGYLTLGKYAVVNQQSDYSGTSNRVNQVYMLTENGKREGSRLV